MLGRLTERLALVASERRRWLFVFTIFLYAAGTVAFVRLPRPRDFAADLPAGHAVEVARHVQREYPLLRLRVAPVDADGAAAVFTAVAVGVADAPIWVGLSARSGAPDGSVRALLNARAVVEQLPTLGQLLSLRADATISQSLDTLAALPDTARVSRILGALADVIRRGKAAPADNLPEALQALVDWPVGAGSVRDDWRLHDGGLDLWLRAQPGTPPEVLERAAGALVSPVRAMGLRTEVDGYPLRLSSPAAPRWHGVLASAPLVLAGALAWAMGVSPGVAAASVIAAGAFLAVPLLLLLALGAGLDPAATWAFCASGGLFGAVMLLYHGLRLGGRSSAEPLLRQVRRALRDSLIGAGLVSLLCLLAGAGVRWAAPAAALSLVGTGLALPLYWGLVLPAVDLTNARPVAEVPLLLRHSTWTGNPRFFAGMVALVVLLGASAAIQQVPTPTRPPPLRGGLPVALATLEADAPTQLVRLRTLAEVQFAEGPTARAGAAERQAVETLARAAGLFLDQIGETSALAESPDALSAAVERMTAVPALADAARQLREALVPAPTEAKAMRLYLSSRSFHHGLQSLRRNLRAMVTRGLANEEPNPFFEGRAGEVLLVAVPANDATLNGVANPLDTFATAREAPLVGGMSWLTAFVGLAGLVFVGLIAAGERFFLLAIPPLAASFPVLRAPSLLGLPTSTLGTAAAWMAAIGTTLFCVTVMRVRTGALAPRGLALAVGACVVTSMLAGSLLVGDTPFGTAAASALATAAVVMAVTYSTA